MSERPITSVEDAVRELGALPVPVGPEPQAAEVFVPRTERSYWVDIAAALNAAHSAGMPVGIDLDGTLTDHNAWSVVWDRAAERWTVAGYEAEADAAEPDGITKVIAPVQALQPVEDPCHPCGCPKRFDRHAWGCPTLADEDPFGLHHTYRVSRDLPELGGQR
ncbi:hypothetical protein P1S61_37800 [Streptomyces sp. ME08-AFT2]|uniref:hypothetical protein n=1 Tax=Streptomyces sp. ME08-AFT2 TaxID=3028683 RepID=UPI0029BBC780|nr:hypothetical protein [Streptomyces sp. ME08-AFT2]MDX3314713.1 hypothetical protein [Streptomyces sp. ME08-AFT2]